MRKVNVEERTRALNEFRMASVSKTFSAPDLREQLVKLGFTPTTAAFIMQHCFPFEKMGNSRLYEVPKEPIHKSIVASAYNKQKSYKKSTVSSTEPSEEEALKLLSQKGYQIRRCIGFDIERFKKEQPVLYSKYLKYECI